MKKVVWTGVAIVCVVIVVLVVRHEGPDKQNGLEEVWAGGKRTEQVTHRQSSGQAETEASEGTGAVPFKDVAEVVPPYLEDNLGAPVKTLLGLDGQEQNYNSLGMAVRQLSMDLSEDDVAALRDMLTWPNDRFPDGMRPIEINSVKNDVLDRLLRQKKLPEDLGQQLVDMYANADNDPVWRDYCIQFMTPFYERLPSEVGIKENTENTESHQSASSAGELKAVRETMFAALDERGGSFAGTSLIGLEKLSRIHEEFDRNAILTTAVEIAADGTADPKSRLTALRLASQKSSELDEDGRSATMELARNLAQTGETVLLRCAAIVTLGEIGLDTDRELLEFCMLADNQQIADAAKLALKKLHARKGPQITQIDTDAGRLPR